MALVKVRTGAVGGEIKRVDQCGIGPVRGVIDGMAVRVRNSKSERRSGASNGELESIVVRRCDVLQREDSAKTRSKRTQTIRAGKILVGSSEAGGFGTPYKNFPDPNSLRTFAPGLGRILL